MIGILQFPDIFVQLCLSGDDFAAVDDASTSHRQDKVNVFFLRQSCALLHLGIGGIGHDPGKLCYGLPGVLQDARQFFIDAVLFDGTAAISEHDVRPNLGKFGSQVFLRRFFTKIDFYRIAVCERIHIFLQFRKMPKVRRGSGHLRGGRLDGCYFRLFSHLSTAFAGPFSASRISTGRPVSTFAFGSSLRIVS